MVLHNIFFNASATIKKSVVGFVLVSLCGCVSLGTTPGIGKKVEFSALPGWESDSVRSVWPALKKNCIVQRKKASWSGICSDIERIQNPSESEVREFIYSWFEPHQVNGKNAKAEGLITGYYEPLLKGSEVKTERFKYPLYSQPKDLLIVDLAELYPDLKGKRVRGRIEGNRVVPYYSRKQIDSEPELLSGEELLWVDSRDDAFFLHIQGSGRVELPTGDIKRVGYANQNGHPYYAIGRYLIDQNYVRREDISLFTIRQWLRENPQQAEELLHKNPSYVFFALSDADRDGPKGSMGIPLTAERSIAIDPKFVELGTLVWLDTTYPSDDEPPYQRLVVAQDTGGAIRGAVRADLFWGRGDRAELNAGEMKQRGKLFVLLPRAPK
ncbi:MAG: MltA domain-containing protein [Pseudomonadota bacterium]